MDENRWRSMGLRLWYVVYSATVVSIVALPGSILWANASLFSYVGWDSAEVVGTLAAGFVPFLVARVALFVATGRSIFGWRW